MLFPATSKTLIDKLSSGDEVSWEEFFSRYSGVVKSLGRLKGLSAPEADDLVQNVMLAFFNRSDKFVFDPKLGKFRTYFKLIVRDRISDIYRKRYAEKSAVDNLDAEDEADEIFDAAVLAEFRQVMLDEALEQLKLRIDDATFTAFDLYARQDKPAEEVAELLGIPVGAVYTAKSRGLKHLRKIIREINEKDGELGLSENGI